MTTIKRTLCAVLAADGTFAKISENWFGYDVCILGE